MNKSLAESAAPAPAAFPSFFCGMFSLQRSFAVDLSHGIGAGEGDNIPAAWAWKTRWIEEFSWHDSGVTSSLWGLPVEF